MYNSLFTNTSKCSYVIILTSMLSKGGRGEFRAVTQFFSSTSVNTGNENFMWKKIIILAIQLLQV